MTLAERKQETREALVVAALLAFARDGYHGASLEGIATDAGYSKGAIYSNFDGKADLFLAVLDYNLAMLGEGWNPLDPPAAPTPDRSEEATEVVRGVELATLEFIATAARDTDLAAALRQRITVMIERYRQVAATARPADERLGAEDVGTLMAAFDQGVSILALIGISSVDGALLRAGLNRLIDPRRAADEAAPVSTDRSTPLPLITRVQHAIQEADPQ